MAERPRSPPACRRRTARQPPPCSWSTQRFAHRRRLYAAALDLLGGNRERLDNLAHTLLAHETLDEADAYAAGFPAPASPIRNLDTTPVDR
jgi:hypothetical protein